MILFKKVLAAVLLVLSGVMLAGEIPSKTVEAEGFGSTVAEAEKNARENAVRQAFGEVIDSVTETKNEELTESTISASSGFILSSKIIGAPKYDSENKYYIIKISAVVATEKIKDQISRFEKSSSKVDIASQLKASEDVEVQEKNALQLLNWFIGELPKTIKITDVKIELDEENSFVLKYSSSYDPSLIPELQSRAKTILLTNGYKKLESDGRTLFPREMYKFEGSIFLIPQSPEHLGWKKDEVEVYHNPNALLFWSPYFEKHPQNYYFTKKTESKFEIRVIKSDGKGKVVEKENIALLNRYVRDASDIKRCSFVPILSGIYSNSKEQRFRPIGTDKLKLPKNVISDEIIVEFAIVTTYPNKKEIRHVLRVETLDCRPVFSLQNSRRENNAACIKFFEKSYREIFKTIKPHAEYSYDRVERRGKLNITLTCDKRAAVNIIRKLGYQIEELTQASNNRDYGVRSAEGRINGRRCWSYSDFSKQLSQGIFDCLNKYSYSLVIKLKNDNSDDLQILRFEKGYSWSLSELVSSYNRYYSSSLLSRTSLEFQIYTFEPRKFTLLVDFDIPEDAKDVKSVECYIEERIKQ